jgi:hypothetical protein
MEYLPIVILHHLRVLSRGNLLQLEPSWDLPLPAGPGVGAARQQSTHFVEEIEP